MNLAFRVLANIFRQRMPRPVLVAAAEYFETRAPHCPNNMPGGGVYLAYCMQTQQLEMRDGRGSHVHVLRKIEVLQPLELYRLVLDRTEAVFLIKTGNGYVQSTHQWTI